jgi:hypothetical protein
MRMSIQQPKPLFKLSCFVIFLVFVYGGLTVSIILWLERVDTTKVSVPNNSEHKKCYWAVESYIPSEWETNWTINLETFKSKVCQTLQQPIEARNAQLLVRRVEELMASNRSAFTYQPAKDDLFSRQQYRFNCEDGQGGSKMETLIEPFDR